MVERVLLDVTEFHKNGKVHDGARKAGSGGKSKLISLDSIEMQIVPDNFEAWA